MSEDYGFAQGKTSSVKFQGFMLWLGVAAIFAFGVFFFLTKEADRDPFLNKYIWIILFTLFLLFVYFPAGRYFKARRTAGASIKTTRKGLSYKDSVTDATYSWKDLENGTVIFDTHPRFGVYMRELRLGNPKLIIENDPYMNEIVGSGRLTKKILEKAPKIRQQIVCTGNLCPRCGSEKTADLCPQCGNKAKKIPRVFKLFYIVRPEIVCTCLVLFLMGERFLPLALPTALIFIGLPVLLTLKKNYKPLNVLFRELDGKAEAP